MKDRLARAAALRNMHRATTARPRHTALQTTRVVLTTLATAVPANNHPLDIASVFASNLTRSRGPTAQARFQVAAHATRPQRKDWRTGLMDYVFIYFYVLLLSLSLLSLLFTPP
jgi:hypothetical protein